MAFNKRTWKGRQGVGLNKFSINGASPVTVVNQPDSITEVGDALSAGNLNDLEDRIESAFTDEATEREADLTDVKNALDATNARVENLEQEHGSYQEVTAKSPYTIPSGKAKNWSVNVLRGVTRADNQLCYRDLQTLKNINTIGSWSNNVYTYQGISYTVNNDGSVTVSGTSTAISLFSTSIDIQGGTSHRYLVCGCPSGGSTTTYMFGSSVMGVYDTNGNGNTFTIGGTTHRTAIRIQSGVTVNGLVFHPTLTDLTTYFNGNIPSNAQTIADIQQNYPELLVPSEYGSSLVSTTYEGVKSKGKNLAQINAFTQSTSYGQIVPCILKKGLTYTVSGTASGGSTMRLLKADSSYQYVATTAMINTTFVAEDDITEASFYGSLTVTNLQIEQGSSKTTFAPWVNPSTLSLPSPITLRSAGSVADTDELNVEVDGVQKRRKTQRIGSVDLSTKNWGYNSGWNCWQSTAPSDIALPSSTTVVVNALWAGMVAVKSSGFTTQSEVNTFAINPSAILFVNNGSTTVAPTGTMYYELADPVVTLSDPIQNPYLPTESGGTISSILTEAVDDSMTLGYINL